MISVELDHQWRRVEVTISNLAKFQHTAAFKSAMDRIAQSLRTKVLNHMRSKGSGDWAKLSPWTIATRKFRGFSGGSKPLMSTGQLMGSVEAETRISAIDTEIFVGIMEGSRSSAGISMADIARIHEHGVDPFVIRVTDKSRKLIGAISQYLRGNTESGNVKARGKGYIITSIPARPIFGPVAEKELDNVAAEIMRVLSGMIR